MSPKDPQLASDLTAARDLLVEKGWIQGKSKIKGRGYCSAAALSVVIGGDPFLVRDVQRYGRALKAVEAQASQMVGHRVSAVVWNDDPLRTEDEVLTAFGRAIKAAS